MVNITNPSSSTVPTRQSYCHDVRAPVDVSYTGSHDDRGFELAHRSDILGVETTGSFESKLRETVLPWSASDVLALLFDMIVTNGRIGAVVSILIVVASEILVAGTLESDRILAELSDTDSEVMADTSRSSISSQLPVDQTV